LQIGVAVVGLIGLVLLALWYFEVFQPTPTVAISSIADDHCDRGFSFLLKYRKEDVEAAINQFKRALEVDPRLARAHTGLARAYAMRVNLFGYPWSWLDTAIEEASVALKLDPDLPEAHMVLATTYRYKGFIDEAQQAIDKALKLHPDDELALIQAGWISIVQGKIDQAYPHFMKALELNPRLTSGYWSVGFIYLALKDFEKAESWIRKALEIQQDDIYALGFLCDCYAAADRLDDMKGIAERLEELTPDLLNGWRYLGHHAYLSSNYQDARDYYDRAIQIGQYFYRSTGSISLAQAHFRLGDEDNARRALTKTRQLVDARLAGGDQGPEPWMDLAAANAMEGNTKEALNCFRKAIDASGCFVSWKLTYSDVLTETLSDHPGYQQLIKDLDSKRIEMRLQVEKLAQQWEQR
jgi:tetratricopeptide (TPR) repeat protein